MLHGCMGVGNTTYVDIDLVLLVRVHPDGMLTATILNVLYFVPRFWEGRKSRGLSGGVCVD